MKIVPAILISIVLNVLLLVPAIRAGEDSLRGLVQDEEVLVHEEVQVQDEVDRLLGGSDDSSDPDCPCTFNKKASFCLKETKKWKTYKWEVRYYFKKAPSMCGDDWDTWYSKYLRGILWKDLYSSWRGCSDPPVSSSKKPEDWYKKNSPEDIDCKSDLGSPKCYDKNSYDWDELCDHSSDDCSDDGCP